MLYFIRGWKKCDGVPTFQEEGVAGLDATMWVGVVGPVGMPKEAIDRLNLAFRRALADPQVIESLLTQGMLALHTSAQEFNTMIKFDYAK